MLSDEVLENFHGEIFYWTAEIYYWKKSVLKLFLIQYSKIQSVVIHFNYTWMKKIALIM